MSRRILVVEDEPAVANLIKKTLDEEQFEVSVAMDGTIALDHIERFEYDLFIFDVMVPGVNGIELCKKIRKSGIGTPVLMVTALGTTDNIVLGLESGADDYLTKPFKIAELMARVKALLRRQNGMSVIPAAIPSASILAFSDLRMNLDEKSVQRKDRTVELTATEFRLLEYLLRNPRKVLSRMDILEKVWGYDFNLNTKVVDVYINYLRKKLNDTAEGRLIHTVIGMGYILKEE